MPIDTRDWHREKYGYRPPGKKFPWAKIFLLLLVIACVVLVGCFQKGSSQNGGTHPLPSSGYPAEISGHVIIAEKVKSLTPISVPPRKESDIFWVIEVSVKNNAYDNVIEASLETGYKGWEIIAAGKVYRPTISGTNEPLSVAPGQTGRFTFHFVVPRSLRISDAKICYRGQQPYSYGSLSGGNRVGAYDLDSKEVIEEVEGADKYEQYFVKREITGYRKVGKMGDVDITEPVYKDVYMNLKTIAHWQKSNLGEETGYETGYWTVRFSGTQAPCVVNWGYEPREFTVLDPIGSKATFVFKIFKEDAYDKDPEFFKSFLGWFDGEGEERGVSDKGVHCVVVHETGDYVIVLGVADVESWWVKVGVE